MNILYLHSGAELYGADRILLALCRGMVLEHHRVFVVLPEDGPLRSMLQSVGCEVYIFDVGVLRRKYFGFFGFLNRFFMILKGVIYLRSVFSSMSIDVVHSNTLTILGGAVFSKISRIKHVWHVHEITRSPVWFVKFMACFVTFFSDKVVFVSMAAKRHLVSYFGGLENKAVVIYNGIDFSRARASLISHNCTPPFKIGMIGRVNRWKGQSMLMTAIGILRDRGCDVRAQFVGGVYPGEEHLKDALLSLRGELGLESIVVVDDFCENIGEVLQSFDVFVLPSIEPDPFPTVVLEAMSAKKAIIGFDHGGIKEMIVDNVSGLLVKDINPWALADMIESLILNPLLRSNLGNEACSRVELLFSESQFINRFNSLYESFS